MSRFLELNDNITYLTDLFLNDQDLCKLLYVTDPTPLASTPIENTSILLFENLFPQPKSVNSITTEKTILTYVFSNSKLNKTNIKFKDTNLILNIISHLNLWRISEGIRPYLIANRIDIILNSLRGTKLSIGQVNFTDMIYREYSDYYCGYYLVYDLCDFN